MLLNIERSTIHDCHPVHCSSRKLYHQMFVNLITHHGELKIGPFNVATESRISTKKLKLNNFWKKSGWQEKFTISFPLLGIEVSTYAEHTSEARELAIEKFVAEAKEKIRKLGTYKLTFLA